MNSNDRLTSATSARPDPVLSVMAAVLVVVVTWALLTVLG